MPREMTIRDALVSTAWLAGASRRPRRPQSSTAASTCPAAAAIRGAEYARSHIPGAAFFDIDAIADPATDLPHMLPPPELFAERAGALGIGSADTRVVVYDAAGSAAAARVWWTFRAFGHDNVCVLDGGLARWLAAGRPVERRRAACATSRPLSGPASTGAGPQPPPRSWLC